MSPFIKAHLVYALGSALIGSPFVIYDPPHTWPYVSLLIILIGLWAILTLWVWLAQLRAQTAAPSAK